MSRLCHVLARLGKHLQVVALPHKLKGDLTREESQEVLSLPLEISVITLLVRPKGNQSF
jgi:hypothetical protein